MPEAVTKPRGRPKGYRVSAEVKERIGKGVSHARHASSIQTQDYWRAKIKTQAILNCLGQHVQGQRDMSATQVQAGLGLLRKVLPDLAAHEHTGEALVTLRTIITGVVRAEDLASSPPVTHTIDHIPSDCDPSASSSASPATQTEEQTSRADLIEKEGE
jgi:hypothetical protein